MCKSQKKSSILTFLTILATVTIFKPSCYSQAEFICPNPTSISPCTCDGADGISIVVNCDDKNLKDSQISRILNTFLAPGLSPVAFMSLKYNQLTKVPKEVSKFPDLLYFDFSNNKIVNISNNTGEPFIKNRLTNGMIWISFAGNQIQTIPLGVFDFPSARSVYINLSVNKIASVPSNAFRFPTASSVEIRLGRNQLNAIPSASFFNFPLAFEMITISLEWNNITSIQRGAFNFIPDAAKSIDINLFMNKIKTIPCDSLTNPLWSNSVKFDLSYNQIATVSSCAFVLPSAKWISVILGNNSISTISPGVFNFPSATFISLQLNNNYISVIPPNTFAQGKYYDLDLKYNKLKRLDSAVFKSPLINLYTFSYMDISENPIDCSTDPCHLAWLLEGPNSSQLLSHIRGLSGSGPPPCAKGYYDPPFSALNSFDFNKKCNCTFN